MHIGRAAQHIGVQHGRADDDAFKFGQAELFGGGVGQQDGHEVEEAVAQGVQDVVGGACAVQDADCHEQGQETLDDAAGGQNAQPGGENAGNDADKGVDRIEFLFGRVAAALGCGAVLVHRAARGDVAHGAHRVIDLGHMVADDHHVLPARLDDGDDAVGVLEDVGLGFALVLQLEAKAGDAVGQRDDVGLAAHVLDDDPRKTVVFACHKRVLLYCFFVGLGLKLHPDPAAAQAARRHGGQGSQGRGVRKALVLDGKNEAAALPGFLYHIGSAPQQGVKLLHQPVRIRRLRHGTFLLLQKQAFISDALCASGRTDTKRDTEKGQGPPGAAGQSSSWLPWAETRTRWMCMTRYSCSSLLQCQPRFLASQSAMRRVQS